MKQRNYAGVPDVGVIPGLYDTNHPETALATDGVPHRKCCEECAFLDPSQPPHIMAACADQGAAFYCIHRDSHDHRTLLDAGFSTPGEQLRVCAGFAAFDAARAARKQGER